MGVLASAALAVVAVVWFRGGKLTVADFFWSVLMFFAACFAAAALAPVYTDSPTPKLQTLVPLAAILATSVFVRRHLPRATFLAGQVVLSVLLVNQFYDLVNDGTSHWTGWDSPNERYSGNRKLAMRHLSYYVKDAAEALPVNPLPAGWLDREPLSLVFRERIDDARIPRTIGTAHPVWHTWLTGLWRVDSRPAGVWYPGGKPADAADHLELRPR
jgi:hypothetical protein